MAGAILFMGISAKHHYRFRYLKSDHWDNLRLKKLVEQDGKCALCRLPAYNNDVHHLDYKHLYDVELRDLRVVCRECHTAVHDLLRLRPEILQITNRTEQWGRIQHLLWKSHTVWRIIPRNKSQVVGMHKAYFKRAREWLLYHGAIFHNQEMPWNRLTCRMMSKLGYRTWFDILEISQRACMVYHGFGKHQFFQNGEH